MVSRAATSGRGIAVTPTEYAAANLRTLRAAWSRELSGILGDDLEAVRDCNQLLGRLEQRLTSDHAGQDARQRSLRARTPAHRSPPATGPPQLTVAGGRTTMMTSVA